MPSADRAFDQQAAEQNRRIGRRAAGSAVCGDEESEADEEEGEGEAGLVFVVMGVLRVGAPRREPTHTPP
jgi:hypothetical protein